MHYEKIILGIILIFSFVFAGDPKKTGEDLGNQFLKMYGGKNDFKNKIVNPINSKTPLTSMKGKDVYFQMGCPAKDNALEIKFIPVGSNEYRIEINEDFNLDGTFDYTYSTSSIGKSVSGVCESGLVFCNKGTWTNCSYYSWTADNTGKVSLVEDLALKDIGHCECTNSSCNMDLILMGKQYIVAGSITNSIMSKNGSFMLSDSKYNDATKTIKVSGQDLTKCTNFADYDKVKEDTPSKYYSESTEMPDVSTEVNYQARVKNSPYNFMQKLPNTYSENRVNCEITRTPTITTSYKYESCSEKVNYNGLGWCVIASDKNCSYAPNKSFACKGWISDEPPTERSGTFLSGTIHPKQKVAVYFAMSEFHGDQYQKYEGDFSVTGDISYATSWITDGNDGIISKWVELDRTTSDNLYISFSVNWHHKGYGTGKVHDYSPQYYWAYLLKELRYEEPTPSLNTINSCPNDATCKIFYEEVCNDSGACVETVKNYTRLNVNIPKNCKEVDANYTTSYLVCADGSQIVADFGGVKQVLYSGDDAYFKIKRIYDCGKTEEKDYNIDTLTKAFNSSSYDNGSLNYENKDGTLKSISFDNPIDTKCPNPYCYVKKSKTDTTAYSDETNKSQFPSGSSTDEMGIRPCGKDENGMTCPVSEGEIVVSPCNCNITEDKTGFEEAMARIGIIDEATKDMICSSSRP